MAKPMRVCDREIVERVICNKYQESKTDTFTKEYEDSSLKKELGKKLIKLRDFEIDMKFASAQVDGLQKDIEESLKRYNEEHAGKKTYGDSYEDAHLSYSRYNASVIDIDFDFPRKVAIGIQDEIGLVTMGGDFEASELIAQLVAKFVK